MSTCPIGVNRVSRRISMDFGIEWPVWNSRFTTSQLVNLGLTIFPLSPCLEKNMNAILTGVLCGNASGDFPSFLSLSLSFLPVLHFSFLSTMGIKSTFLATTPLVCFALTNWFLPSVMGVLPSMPPYLLLAGNSICFLLFIAFMRFYSSFNI